MKRILSATLAAVLSVAMISSFSPVTYGSVGSHEPLTVLNIGISEWNKERIPAVRQVNVASDAASSYLAGADQSTVVWVDSTMLSQLKRADLDRAFNNGAFFIVYGEQVSDDLFRNMFSDEKVPVRVSDMNANALGIGRRLDGNGGYHTVGVGGPSLTNVELQRYIKDMTTNQISERRHSSGEGEFSVATTACTDGTIAHSDIQTFSYNPYGDVVLRNIACFHQGSDGKDYWSIDWGTDSRAGQLVYGSYWRSSRKRIYAKIHQSPDASTNPARMLKDEPNSTSSSSSATVAVGYPLSASFSWTWNTNSTNITRETYQTNVGQWLTTFNHSSTEAQNSHDDRPGTLSWETSGHRLYREHAFEMTWWSVWNGATNTNSSYVGWIIWPPGTF